METNFQDNLGQQKRETLENINHYRQESNNQEDLIKQNDEALHDTLNRPLHTNSANASALKNKVNNRSKKSSNSRMTNQLASAGLQAAGVPKAASDAIVNSKLGQKALEKAKRQNPMLNAFDKLMGGRSVEDDTPTEGFVNFKIPPKAKKIMLISSIPSMVFIVFCCLFIAASQTYINVIGIGAADESVNIDEKIENSTDEEKNEEITDENLSAYNVTIKKKTYASSYVLTNSISKFNSTIREDTEVDLSELEDYYGANSDNETINGFFYKLRDIYKRYNKEINVKLDLPLLMSTLMLQSKDMDIVFKSNTSESYDRTDIDSVDTHILDYSQDWTGYLITLNNSAHDIEILAQNMVTKDENGNYSIDYDKYDEFLKEFLDKKYYIKEGGIYNGTSAEIPSYETENEQAINSLIVEIYNAKEQYEDLVGDYSKAPIINTASNNLFWWPIGSSETEERNGVLYATGDPAITVITSYYGGDDGFRTNAHGGLDVGNGGNGPGVVNIIAAKSGEVVYPLNDAQTQYSDNGYYGNPDGGGFGNYVKIKHSDGTYTIYAHLSKGSITVRSGDVVAQGQVIGKMGHSGSSTGTHLHFEVRLGSDAASARKNPLDYIDPENPRPMSYGSGDSFSLTTTSLSKEEFIARMNDYANRVQNQGFYNNFVLNAEEIYAASIAYNINPELVVVTAGTEQSWTLSAACQYTNNYWGIGITNGNGCNSGGKYDSLSDGIKAYAEILSSYNEFGSYASMIKSKYDQRASSSCDTSGHGLPGTLVGMQSIYSFVGTYRYNPGNAGLGGCYYLNILYGDNYCSSVPSCYDSNNCSVESQTTVCEQNDYTAWQVKKKMQLRYDIFGL